MHATCLKKVGTEALKEIVECWKTSVTFHCCGLMSQIVLGNCQSSKGRICDVISGCISAYGMGHLHTCDSSVNTEKYT